MCGTNIAIVKQYQCLIAIMKTANYYILDEIFGLLERIEIMDGVQFYEFDPDNFSDVERIARRYIEPELNRCTVENRRKIQWAFEYYSGRGSAPFQQLRDQHQELSLPDARNWPDFFRTIGQLLFSADKKDICLNDEFVEVIDEIEGQTILSSSGR